VIHSRIFPGLRLDVPALLAADSARVLDTLEIGLRDPKHAEFVAKLGQKAKR